MLKRKKEKYKIKKGILKNVLNLNQPLDVIKSVVLRMNKMTIYAYQFLEAYYLHCFHQNIDLPILDINFLRLIYRSVSFSREKRGTGLHTKEQKDRMSLLDKFYTDHFSKVIVEPLPLSDNLIFFNTNY